MNTLTRRWVLGAMAAGTTLPAVGWRSLHAPATAPGYRFFAADEARLVEAMCDRLIPEDAAGIGALGAAVPAYLDQHLAGAWGAGTCGYRDGPWLPGTPTGRAASHGIPADYFRAALAAIRGDPARGGAAAGARGGACFDQWLAPAQDAYLRQLSAGTIDLRPIDSADFFQLLLSLTLEGFFTQAPPANSRERISWTLRGFPGSYAI